MGAAIVTPVSMHWIIKALIVGAVVLLADIIFITVKRSAKERTPTGDSTASAPPAWQAPDSCEILSDSDGALIHYGKELVARTSYYLGPRGSVAAISNGMNCQNCHLDAGARLYGNNFSAVFSTYPKFRERSGTVENIYKRVNDCLERSLNGASLDTNSREMRAFSAYINWVGQRVPKNNIPAGAGITNLPFLDRAADPGKGHLLYIQKCQLCHGKQGEGLLAADSLSYTYPPLWGEYSYNTAAGLYRLSRLAGYIKDNMPFGASHHIPQLTDEEAWDVAAFVNSQPRPEKRYKRDWPALTGKPVDHPFGPYADSFSERQHKLGPFGPIRAANGKRQSTTSLK